MSVGVGGGEGGVGVGGNGVGGEGVGHGESCIERFKRQGERPSLHVVQFCWFKIQMNIKKSNHRHTLYACSFVLS